ncbi:transcriptional regulator [Bordetella genomosp. 1]|uniref:Transcriptional regulator n=1 Tax=Bordetella genomosp. 1 TaxID=1395607 RepID=A0A261S6U8_9BORD|nr:XRE family transcriptional regulator [Bordetella genomosp. 1]OZI33104.1 transcriptional regulator [Bordetella genomosp. 1]
MEDKRESALALRLRALRQERRWTLKQAAQASGVAASTLSKIENNLLSPTYDNLLKIAAGLELDVAELFMSPAEHMGTGRRSVNHGEEGRPYQTPYYDHLLLCTALSHKRMMPFRTRVKARSFDEFADWSRHRGEEFVYVLEGEIELHTEFYSPARLKAGECFYIDSRMGHRVISRSKKDALVLWVSTSDAMDADAEPPPTLEQAG